MLETAVWGATGWWTWRYDSGNVDGSSWHYTSLPAGATSVTTDFIMSRVIHRVCYGLHCVQCGIPGPDALPCVSPHWVELFCREYKQLRIQSVNINPIQKAQNQKCQALIYCLTVLWRHIGKIY
jgi:hypothetical protein